MTLAPNLMNMTVGETRTIQALDPTGHPVTGLPWTTSDATVVSVSSTDPQVLTALAAGHVTITAGSASADVTVWADAMPQGTVLWSNPGNGSGVTKIVPAVPSPTGVADVFAFQGDGTVQAITSEGITAWTADAADAWFAVPDFQGGLVVTKYDSSTNSFSIGKLDGQTGQAYPAYTTNVDGSLERMVVHPDGTIFAVERDYSVHPHTASVIGIDSLTGIRKFSVPLQHEGDWWADCEGSELMIAGDGYAYAPYGYRIGYGSAAALRVLRISSSGAYDTISLPNAKDVWLDVCVPHFHVITNADKGVVVTWGDDTAHMVTTTGVSVGVASPTDVGVTRFDELIPVLQAADGSFVGTREWEDEAWESHFTMVAFDETGNVRWSVPGYEPKIATADGGVIAQAWDEDAYDFTGAVVRFDQNGNATGQMESLPVQSWTGNEYPQRPLVESMVAPLVFESGASFWPTAGGNPSGNGTAIVQCPCLLQSTLMTQSPLMPQPPMGMQSAGTIVTAAHSDESQKTYLVMAGDPGLNLGDGHNHSVGQLFNLAAATKASVVSQSGNNVLTKTVSSFADFKRALTANGLIDGDIVFFGHGGLDGHGNPALFPGQDPGDAYNVSILNVGQLSSVNLGPDVTVTLNACHAGLGGKRSIAQLIANQLNRPVLAYPVDMYFSSDPTPRRFSKGMVSPTGPPVYMVPNSDGMQPTWFRLH